MPRMLLEVVVDTPFGPLRVMTTHLEYYSAPQRAAQVEALRARHAEACAHALAGRAGSDAGDGTFRRQPQTVSAILTGDFNFRPSDPLHARHRRCRSARRACRLRGRLAATASAEAQPPTLGVHDRDQWPEPFACDFIFVTSDLRSAPARHRRRRRHRRRATISR